MESNYLYLLVLALSALVPLVRSFERRIAFYRSFKELFLAIALVGGFFIVWDVIFTRLGYWGFNDRYLIGLYLVNLPVEEWLFFVVIPFCCVFIYRVLNYFFPKTPWGPKITTNISNFLFGFSVALAITFYDRWYTFLTFSLLGVTILLHQKYWQAPWLGKFYRAFAVVLIPFLIVDGILTGFGIDEQIVWYKESEITGTRIFSIPFEDFFYGMLLSLGVTSLYEYFGRRSGKAYAYETTTE